MIMKDLTPRPFMLGAHTYMTASDKDPVEIVAKKKDLYATNFGGGQVDITSGKFVFSASEAYWVENGKSFTPSKVPPWSAVAQSA